MRKRVLSVLGVLVVSALTAQVAAPLTVAERQRELLHV